MRNKGGLGGRMYPTFEMYLEEPNQFLLAGRKKGGSKSSNYTITRDKTNFEKGENYLGKLRSNFLGTEFVIYDKGSKSKEKKKTVDEGEDDDTTGRNELGAIVYESNLLGSKGPRQMVVAIPLSSETSEWSSKDSILKAYKEDHPSLFVLGNKPPKWNAQARAYVLDFNNRVTKPSVKNFQLINAKDPNTVIFQFGRVGKESFSLDFRWPLSPIQAFAIALSSCDYKLVCE
jgi:tubby-related protein 1